MCPAGVHGIDPRRLLRCLRVSGRHRRHWGRERRQWGCPRCPGGLSGLSESDTLGSAEGAGSGPGSTPDEGTGASVRDGRPSLHAARMQRDVSRRLLHDLWIGRRLAAHRTIDARDGCQRCSRLRGRREPGDVPGRLHPICRE